MFELVAIPCILQVALPLGLMAWLAVSRHASRFSWLVLAIAIAVWLAAMARVGLWLIVPRPLLWVLAGLFVVVLFRSARGVWHRPVWPRGWRAIAGAVMRSGIAIAAALLLVAAVAARTPPGPTVDLILPLTEGTILVANGGNASLINAHHMTLAGERFRPYRGQSYGADLVRINALGIRARGLLPDDPAAYAIFGNPVVAPCDGTVIRAQDGLPDLPPPQVDRANLAGNHVIVDCDGIWIVLAHFQRGSVMVTEGTPVRTGELIGRVGNSGNTSEPHLHIHAQTPARATSR